MDNGLHPGKKKSNQNKQTNKKTHKTTKKNQQKKATQPTEQHPLKKNPPKYISIFRL